MGDSPVEKLALRDRPSAEVEPPKTFLSMPNEVLRRIVGKELSMPNRKIIKSVCERLRFIEKTAGYRRIESAGFSRGWNPTTHRTSLVINARFPNFKCEGNRPEQDAIDFFNNASIDSVEIDESMVIQYGIIRSALFRLDAEKERKVRVILTSASFKKFAYTITDEHSCRILQVLLDQRNGLELLAINFDCANVDAATSTALLLSLPPVHKYCIISVQTNRELRSAPNSRLALQPIDDMILLRLVANASVVEINCMKTTITRQGAIDAFAIVCSKDRPRKVQFPLNRGYLDNVERYHQESGATINSVGNIIDIISGLMDLPIEKISISDVDSSVDQKTFLSLPDDILTKIAEKELAMADRANLS
ncbi:hypothetical protein PRIPAC_91255 [Pristionchus pacificus]|uniref:Uncharacterized protein n=1 Tax=Pristionchus pacificus TaxID=54126 RepID=A0A2A6B9L6_PRIPA|nr:hypothetical protein PRIPAC_91255 [Pristionchus pacificus]|eukprot:PDM62569.1 hypothetical protein PRIPAC_52011 [Pristionchus pacificus]